MCLLIGFRDRRNVEPLYGRSTAVFKPTDLFYCLAYSFAFFL